MTGQEKLYWKIYNAQEMVANGWCKGSGGAFDDGTACSHIHPMATKFCMLGANAKSGGDDYSVITAINEVIRKHIPPEMLISDFNDAKATTLEDVLEVYEMTLIQLKGEIDTNGRDNRISTSG